MKKALSLVLAVVLVFGMTVTAFAATGALTFDSGATISSVSPSSLVFAADGTTEITIVMDEPLMKEDGTGTPVMIPINVSTDVKSLITRVYLTSSTLGARTLTVVSATAVNTGTAGSEICTITATVKLPSGTPADLFSGVTCQVNVKDGSSTLTDSGTVGVDTVDYTGSTSGNENIGGGTTTDTTQVPTTYRITGIASNWNGTYGWGSTDWDALTGDMSIKSVPLTIDMFDWEVRTSGSTYHTATATELSLYAGANVRSSHLTNVTVRTSNTKNMGGTIDEIKIDGDKLKVTTVEYFMKCGKTEGYFDLSLAYKGRTSGVKESIVFTIENEKEEIDEYWTYVDTDDHIYLEATETIRYLEMYSGNNLYVTRGMSKGQKIYCRSDITMSTADEKLFYEYAELDSVYTMRTIGVSAAGTTIQFKDLVDTYFVYDSNYKLIGTTADSKLPWSEKYYLATKKVDLGGAPAVDEAPADVEPTAPGVTDNEGLGGDEAPVVPNANYNPNTGL